MMFEIWDLREHERSEFWMERDGEAWWFWTWAPKPILASDLVRLLLKNEINTLCNLLSYYFTKLRFTQA